MSSRRVLKAAQAIREVVSMAIITDLKDPRIRDVTVTLVEVTPDMRQAKVNVSVMGDEAKQKLCLHGLQNSAGFLQQKVGKRIDTRYTPRIQFVLDKGVQHSLIVTRILEEVLPQESGPDTDLSEESDTDSSEESNMDLPEESNMDSSEESDVADDSNKGPQPDAQLPDSTSSSIAPESDSESALSAVPGEETHGRAVEDGTEGPT